MVCCVLTCNCAAFVAADHWLAQTCIAAWHPDTIVIRCRLGIHCSNIEHRCKVNQQKPGRGLESIPPCDGQHSEAAPSLDQHKVVAGGNSSLQLTLLSDSAGIVLKKPWRCIWLHIISAP